MAFTNKLLDPKNDVAFIGRDTVIEKAYKELDRFYWTEGELLGYEAALKKERDYKAVMDQKFDDGLAQGKIKERFEVARKMLAKNKSDDEILEFSGLTLEELAELKQQLNAAG
jgi:hypothetical protein